MAVRARSERLRSTLARLAPGTELREGLERILRGRTGALIVIGSDPAVQTLCDGGFTLDVAFSATRLRELSKMDGAVVLSTDGTRILRANVQLMPDAGIPTDESGTRHRTAERVALQTGYPVISVSQSMSLVSIYVDGKRHPLADTSVIFSRANHALSTLERYTSRLQEVTQSLSALEIEDFVTLKDALTVVQRLEMVRRVVSEINNHVVELGTDGALITRQLDELVGGLSGRRDRLLRDYLPLTGQTPSLADVQEALDALDDAALLDLAEIARCYGHVAVGQPVNEILDQPVNPRGYRLLAGIPRLPQGVQDRLVHHFGSLQALLAATAEDLQTVEGIGETRATLVREGLSRLVESSIVERYA